MPRETLGVSWKGHCTATEKDNLQLNGAGTVECPCGKSETEQLLYNIYNTLPVG